MSAGAVRQGGVFVEIGADPKEFLSAVAQVNRQIAGLGSSMSEVGVKLGAVGALIATPITAAAAQFGNLGDMLRDIQGFAGLAAGDMDGLTRAAASLGLVIDKQTAMSALQLAASTNKMRLSMLAVATTIGSIVAPEFVGFAEGVSRVARQASDFLRENRKIVTVASAVGFSLLGVGVALTTVGQAMKSFGSSSSLLLSPMTSLIGGSISLAGNIARLGVAFVAANPLIAGVGVVLAVASVAAVQAAGGIEGAAKVVSGAFGSILEAAQATFPNMTEVVTSTVSASYNALASGDFFGAASILWEGAKTAWEVGTSALMGVLDPWIESAQNAWGNMGATIAIMWEQVWTGMATSEWGGYFLGAFDNVINAAMASWDRMTGNVKKGWAWLQSKFKIGFDIQAEIAKIDQENAARSEQRGRDRPGFAGRTGLTDEEKNKLRAESEARIADIVAGNEQAIRDRRKRTEQRAADRPAEVAAAVDGLKQEIKRVVEAPRDLAPITRQQISGPAQVLGTFSALAAGGMGSGTKGIAEQQLDVLRQIAFNTKEQGGRVGP